MGMFDSIYIEMKCPYCGETSEIECQTKELECMCHVFRKGDTIGTDQYNWLECTASCRSKKCLDAERRNAGYRSGFGQMFLAKVFLNAGEVTGEYKITNTENGEVLIS